MFDIISEINEEQRQLKIAKFISKYFLLFIIIIILLGIGVFIYKSNQEKIYKESENLEIIYNKITDKEELSSADIKNLDQIISKDNLFYSQLASLKKAAFIKNKSNISNNIYNNLYNNKKTELSIKYLAKLLSLSDIDNNEKIIDQELLNKQNPFYFSTILLELDQLSYKKNYKKAYEVSSKLLQDSSLPLVIKKRITELVKIFKQKKDNE